MAKKYRRKSYQEKQEEIKKLTESMDHSIESYFVSPEKLRNYLTFMGQFYRYSPGNVALIQSQFDGARAVGSFKFWKDKGYSVNKGEHGLRIWVPVKLTAKFQTEKGIWKSISKASLSEKEKIESGELRSVPARTGFTLGHVFDISQTNCPPEKIPELFPNRHIPGEIKGFETYQKGLLEVTKNLGVKLLPAPPRELGAAKGAYYPKLHALALNPRDSEYEKATTLVHELAHAALHNRENKREMTDTEREFQAEMTAYVVNTHFGIDTKKDSLSYLSSWTKGKTLEYKKQLIGEVHETALRFINTMEKTMEEAKRQEQVTPRQQNRSGKQEPLQENEQPLTCTIEVPDTKSQGRPAHQRVQGLTR